MGSAAAYPAKGSKIPRFPTELASEGFRAFRPCLNRSSQTPKERSKEVTTRSIWSGVIFP